MRKTTKTKNLVRVTVKDGIGTLTMNDPDSCNSMSLAMMDALRAACESINSRSEIRALIVTGAGEAFSAGGNMHDMTEREGLFASEEPMWARDMNLSQVHKIPNAIYGIRVPTIAAVNGHAIGGGCDISVMCDIRIASSDAVFAASFLRVGLLPGDGGAWFLPRAIGLSRAMEMALTCDFIDAATAERIGLVSRVVPPDRLLAEANAIAARIARHPTEIACMTKRLLRFGAQSSLPDALEMTATMQGIVQTSETHRAAARRIAATMKSPAKSVKKAGLDSASR